MPMCRRLKINTDNFEEPDSVPESWRNFFEGLILPVQHDVPGAEKDVKELFGKFFQKI